jgi:hypothetical protein
MYSNAKYLASGGVNTAIQCDIRGVQSIVPLDLENSDCAAIMALVAADELSIDDAALPPATSPALIILTNRQLFIALALAGFISEAEALAAARMGTVPAAIEAVFTELPSQDAFAARVTWATMREIPRNHSLITAMIGAGLATGEDVDGIFTLGASIP